MWVAVKRAKPGPTQIQQAREKQATSRKPDETGRLRGVSGARTCRQGMVMCTREVSWQLSVRSPGECKRPKTQLTGATADERYKRTRTYVGAGARGQREGDMEKIA